MSIRCYAHLNISCSLKIKKIFFSANRKRNQRVVFIFSKHRTAAHQGNTKTLDDIKTL